mgnify:CR=1 FL=1
MIEELRIRGLGVIADATLPLHPGLNVLTGETGAGKTMVVTALGLLLGSRADPGVVRAGSATLVDRDMARLDDAAAIWRSTATTRTSTARPADSASRAAITRGITRSRRSTTG